MKLEGRRFAASLAAFTVTAALSFLLAQKESISVRAADAVTFGALVLLFYAGMSLVMRLRSFALFGYTYKRLTRKMKTDGEEKPFGEGYKEYLKTKPDIRICAEAFIVGGAALIISVILAATAELVH